MKYHGSCPTCGAPGSVEHRNHSDDAGEHGTRSELLFARVLNGTPWREKPSSPPRHRDDNVPFD
jgi:hypothetical protein